MSVSSFIIHYVVLGIYRFAEGHNIEGLRDIALAFIQVGHRQTEAVWAIRGWQGD